MVSLATLMRKVIFFPLTRMVIALIAIISAVVLESAGLQTLYTSYGLRDQAWFAILAGAVVVGTVCAIYCGYVRLFERRAVRSWRSGRP